MIENFVEIDILETLLELRSDTAPQWGSMSAQHMIEHVSDLLKISNGTNQLKIPDVPEHMFDNMRRFLLGKTEFPKGFKSPLISDDLPPFRLFSLEAAIDELQNEREKFVEYFELNPESKPFNPTFGKLNRDQWMLFHNKHFTHHFKQFGIEL